jgi:hypothetical protein
MASLRMAITILRLTGETSIAAALRHHARRPANALQTIMNCQRTTLPGAGEARMTQVAGSAGQR